jgi:hypothetical protein
MRSPFRVPIPLSGAMALVTVVVFGACSDSQPTVTGVEPPLPAKGGGAGGNPVVSATDPTEAEQDTTLDVRVLGSGFDDGSSVRLLLNGKPTKKIKTNSTRFETEEELVANITIALDAEVASYDVEVTTSRRRKGIGTELFAVKEKTTGPFVDTPLTVTLGDRTGDRITSDGDGVYSEDVDFVVAHIRPPGIGTFIFDTADRFVCVDFTDAGEGQTPFPDDCVDVFGNTVGGPGHLDFHTMSVGDSETVGFQIFWKGQDYEWFLRYGGACGQTPASGLPVDITHPTDDTWTIEGKEALLCKRPLKGKPTWTWAGDFTMPFFMTLEVKP